MKPYHFYQLLPKRQDTPTGCLVFLLLERTGFEPISMGQSGGLSLAAGWTAATPLFSSLREENANESRHSDQNRQFSLRKLAVFLCL